MRWVGVAVVVAALAVVAAGCGGSSDAGSEAASDTTATETSVVDTSASTTDTSTDTTSGDSSTDMAGLSDECKDLVEASQKFSAAAASSTSGGSDNVEATAEAFAEFAKQAPDELKDDFAALASVITQYADALKDLDLKPGEVPNAEQIGKLAKLSQALGTEKTRKASAAIAAWGATHCTSTP